MRKEVIGRHTANICWSKEIKAKIETEHRGEITLGVDKNQVIEHFEEIGITVKDRSQKLWYWSNKTKMEKRSDKSRKEESEKCLFLPKIEKNEQMRTIEGEE